MSLEILLQYDPIDFKVFVFSTSFLIYMIYLNDNDNTSRVNYLSHNTLCNILIRRRQTTLSNRNIIAP